MLSVGSKLALLIFGIMILMLVVLLLLTSNPFLQLFRMEPFLEIDPKIEVSSLISTVLVFLLVWERLTESLDRKLKFVHEILDGFYHRLRIVTNLFRIRADEIERVRNYLKRYGKFLTVIPLHPLKWKRIDKFISLLESFQRNIQQILELAEKEIDKKIEVGLNGEKILKNLGFEPIDPSQYSPVKEEEYSRVAQKLLSEHLKLINVSLELLEDLKKVRKEIYGNLDDFIKTNNLPYLLSHRVRVPGP
ncbi:MAG: hypothetical protein OEZ29_01360 [Candidatus Bathyarchaeota archaeon]|nr:hypothetical protein [Candidatus Bathyarchaeota archaeon]MDH5779225.1 hypothetical protein [Candidatus Bathyarchaeota archaeon]